MKESNLIPCSAAVSILLVAQKPRFIVAARNMFFTVQLQNNGREIWGGKKTRNVLPHSYFKMLKKTHLVLFQVFSVVSFGQIRLLILQLK